VHETPQQRTTWAPHGIDAYYVGPSLEHYRCYKFFVPKINTTRDATSGDWFPTNIKYPQVTTETFLRQTAEDLLHLLTQRNNPSTTLTFGSPIMNAYVQIAQTLQRAIAPQQHRAKEPRVINAKLSTAPNTRQEPRVLTGIPSKQTGDTPRAPNATLATASNTSPIVSPNKEPASGHITDDVFEAAANATSGRSSTYQPRATTCHHANSIIKQHKHQQTTTTPPLKGRAGTLTNLFQNQDKLTWMQSLANEFTRLLPHTSPTSNRIIGTGTIAPILKHSIPQDRKITYANFICDYRPQKAETHRVRMTAGGDRLDYPDGPSSPAVSILNTKIHINSTISDIRKGAR